MCRAVRNPQNSMGVDPPTILMGGGVRPPLPIQAFLFALGARFPPSLTPAGPARGPAAAPSPPHRGPTLRPFSRSLAPCRPQRRRTRQLCTTWRRTSGMAWTCVVLREGGTSSRGLPVCDLDCAAWMSVLHPQSQHSESCASHPALPKGGTACMYPLANDQV